MNDAASNACQGRSGGLYESAKTLLSTLLGILHTRGELLATELEEERVRLEQRVLLGLAGLLCLAFGLLFLTLWLVVAAGENHRLAALGGAAIFYLVLGVGVLLRLRHAVRSKPRLFETSLAELAKDRSGLASRS